MDPSFFATRFFTAITNADARCTVHLHRLSLCSCSRLYFEQLNILPRALTYLLHYPATTPYFELREGRHSHRLLPLIFHHFSIPLLHVRSTLTRRAYSPLTRHARLPLAYTLYLTVYRFADYMYTLRFTVLLLHPPFELREGRQRCTSQTSSSPFFTTKLDSTVPSVTASPPTFTSPTCPSPACSLVVFDSSAAIVCEPCPPQRGSPRESPCSYRAARRAQAALGDDVTSRIAPPAARNPTCPCVSGTLAYTLARVAVDEYAALHLPTCCGDRPLLPELYLRDTSRLTPTPPCMLFRPSFKYMSSRRPSSTSHPCLPALLRVAMLGLLLEYILAKVHAARRSAAAHCDVLPKISTPLLPSFPSSPRSTSPSTDPLYMSQSRCRYAAPIAATGLHMFVLIKHVLAIALAASCGGVLAT